MSRVYFLHAFFYKHLRGREGRWAWGMQDLSYVTRGWSRAPSTGSTESWPLNTKKSIQTPKLPVFWPICRENTQLTRLLFPNLSHLGLLQMVRLKTSVHPNQSSASPLSSGARKWKVKVSQSCPTLVTPWTLACQAPVHGIFQARILEWVVIFFSWGSSWPVDRTWVSHIAGGFFTEWATREAQSTIY